MRRFTFLLLLLVLICGSTSLVFASPSSGWQLQFPYYDPEGSTTSCVLKNQANTVANGKVYMIGDSITASVKPLLETSFKQAGYTDVYIDAVASRRLTAGSDDLDGLSVLDKSADQISNANTVVVALGTNGGITAANIAKTIQTITGHNLNNPKIFWVTIGVDNEGRQKSGNTIIDIAGVNSLINTGKGYALIDWANKVNVDRSLIDNTDGLGVHLAQKGKTVFTDTVVSSTLENLAQKSCGTVSDNLTGSDNAEKIYNFFISKGLSPVQAAGFMGNIQDESHFETGIVEYSWKNSRGETSTPGSPTSLDTEVPPDQNEKGQPGYGLVQWTAPGRKQALRDYINQKRISSPDLPASDLQTQLEFLWIEVTTSYKKSTLTPLLAATSVEQSTYIVTENYEIPSKMAQAKVRRLNFAQKILIMYGSEGLGQ